MPAANISADLRQTAVNSGDFHIRSFDSIASRDATAAEGTIRTGDKAYVQATGLYYEWDGASFQPFGFPPPLEPTSPSLTIVTTQQQLDDAINAIPDSFAGEHEIEVRASGLTLVTASLPRPSFGTLGRLDIIADRSVVTATNAAASFVLDPTTSIEYEDPAFGGAVPITAGNFWVSLDLSAFGDGFGIWGVPALPSAAGSARVPIGFALSGPAVVYPISTTLDILGGGASGGGKIEGDGALNQFGRGVRIIGFRANFGTTVSVIGMTFSGCDMVNARLEDCSVSGHLGVGSALTLTASGRFFSSNKPGLNYFHASGGSIQLLGIQSIGTIVSEVMISLESSCKITNVSACDLRPASGPCFRYQLDNVVNVGPNLIRADGAAMFSPLNTSSARLLVSFDAGVTVTGTVVDAFVIQNGGMLINADAACEGTLVATGSEVLLDGVPFTYLDGVVGVFSLDTGSFMGS